MEYLYLDESGQFEGKQAKPVETFVGGFITTAEPPKVARAFERLFQAATADPQLPALHSLADPSGLHMLGLYKALGDAELDSFRRLALRHLRDLDGLRFVSTHYFEDTHAEFEGARDAHGAHRFIRMWQATLRNVLYYQPEPGDLALNVYTAQRSIPLDLLEAKERFYMQSFQVVPMGDREGFKVVSSEQVPRLLLGVLSRGTSAQFPRSFQNADVGGPLTRVTQRQIERQPFLSGLLLADIACDLINLRESGAETEVAKAVKGCRALRMAYHPSWERYERLCESAGDSRCALEELIGLALEVESSPTTAGAWLSSAASALLTSMLQRAAPRAPLRAHFLAIADSELRRKEGRFPACERILGEGGLRRPAAIDEVSFDEWILRIAYGNHTGREAADERSRLEAGLLEVLDSNVEALLHRGEDLAHLAVNHQDEFDYDTAAALAEGYLERVRPVFELVVQGRRGSHWTTYGRVLSNLAQTYAYRQADGDLDRARELMRQARPHMVSWLDRSQWGCHAGNLAGLVGDEGLLVEALDVLFETHVPDRLTERMTSLRFGPESRTEALFGLTVLTRLAVQGGGTLADELRARLAHAPTWRTLFDNVRDARPTHPLELYARHLLELAPAECADQEAEVLGLALRGFGNRQESRVANTLNAGTLVAYAIKLTRRGAKEQAQQQVWVALQTFDRSFAENPYVSTTTYYADMESGWFFEAHRALTANPSTSALEAFLSLYRYEWR